jgi:hypothetical protein
MKQERIDVQISGRQLSLIFEPDKVDGMNEADRTKAVWTLARILMQAAGLRVEEEVADDKH